MRETSRGEPFLDLVLAVSLFEDGKGTVIGPVQCRCSRNLRWLQAGKSASALKPKVTSEPLNRLAKVAGPTLFDKFEGVTMSAAGEAVIVRPHMPALVKRERWGFVRMERAKCPSTVPASNHGHSERFGDLHDIDAALNLLNGGRVRWSGCHLLFPE